MNIRTTLILFLAFVALAVFAWTLRDREGTQYGNTAPEPTPGPMWDFTADDVTEVVVSRGADEYTLTRDGERWTVDGEATSDEVDGLVGRIAEPSILRVLPEDRDPDVYGFDTPAVTITLRTTDTTTILHRGDQVPTTSNYYMRLADGGPIRIWSGFDIDRLEEWIDAPPLAPTPTPEASEGEGEDAGEGEGEGEEGEDAEDDADADADVEEGEEGDADGAEGEGDGDAEEGAEATDTDDDGTPEAGGGEDEDGTATAAATAGPSSTPTPSPTPDEDEEDQP